MTTIYNIFGMEPDIVLDYPDQGDIAYHVQVRSKCVISLANQQTSQMQRMTIMLQQSGDGNCEVEFGTPIHWQDRQPFIDTRASMMTIVEIMFDGTSQFYGRLIYG